MRSRIFGLFVLFTLLVATAMSQTSEFTYQGQLQSSSAPANGAFDFEFALFDSQFGGSQIGGSLLRNGVAVSNGILSVTLDFGQAFPGANRFLEIRVRPSGGGAFTTLSPRQSVGSSPYSIKSLAAESATSAASALTAANAQTALNFSGPLAGDVTGIQNSTTVARLRGTNVASTTPTNGQVLKFNGAANQWQPDTDITGSGGGSGTITGVTAGTGLTGGGTTGSVTVGIANGGVGSPQLADGSVTNAKIENLSVGNSKIANGAVTDAKIASGNVVLSLNSLRDNVTLAAGSNITITPSGNTLTIASTGGSGNVILNQTTQQTGANFNIGGNGTVAGSFLANIVSAATQFNVGNNRILSNPGNNNVFAGVNAGALNTTGSSNAFFGSRSGEMNTTGLQNAFFGSQAGSANTTGNLNAFFGNGAGSSNTTASGNAFFGQIAGSNNTTGTFNSFFGTAAGLGNTTSSNNSFFGYDAGRDSNGFGNSFFGYRSGLSNTAGSSNSFFGSSAGQSTTSGVENTFVGSLAGFTNGTGSGNTTIGWQADVFNAGLTNATAVGFRAEVAQSNSMVLGSISGINGSTADTNVGIGTAAPTRLLHVKGKGSDSAGVGDVIIEAVGGNGVGAALTLNSNGYTGGRRWSLISTGPGADAGTASLAFLDAEFSLYRMVITGQGTVGIGTTAPTATLSVNGTANKPGGGSWGTFSDERLKNIKGRFSPGLNELLQLEPIRYEYKSENALGIESEGEHVGFSAQAVQKVIPEAVTETQRGYLQINNDPILWTMLNAIKEQQSQIEGQKARLAAERSRNLELKAEVAELKLIVCSVAPTAKLCVAK